MIRTLRLSIYYQLLMSLRMKQALFFTLAFPMFLFVLFGNLWGQGNPEYVPFILTGILGMNVATEGIFAIGPALKDYYSSGVLRYFKKLPFNILTHFFGLITSQLIMMLMSTVLLLLTAALLFGMELTPALLARVVLGVSAGIVVFGFIGLSVAFLNVKKSSGPVQKGGLGNVVYYVLVFLSDAFYPLGDMNVVLRYVTKYSPMNPVLNIMRGEPVAWLPLVAWTVIGMSLFVVQFRRFTSTR
ncbi:ABC transporter permease [Hymenobacter algoricola]|uniref:ABC-2 type transporter transmembrane domain-containing protein n=1 Tax=Hymenobacter algoricola TaxID=486267 RepID=A0ABP7MGD4_9BACT